MGVRIDKSNLLHYMKRGVDDSNADYNLRNVINSSHFNNIMNTFFFKLYLVARD